MNLLKTWFYGFLFLAPGLALSEEPPSQTELLKKGAFHFFKDLPGVMARNYLKSHGADRFSLYRRMHNYNRKKSPFRYIEKMKVRSVPSKEHGFDFINSAYDFSNVASIEFGVCSSLSYALRRFHLLSYFDKKNVLKDSVPNREKTPKSWLKFYQKKIDRIFRLQPAIFPYFSNLRELSTEPELKTYIQKQILNLWVKKNVSLRGLVQLFSVKKRGSLAKSKKLYRKIKERLNLGYAPIIFLSQPRDTILGPSEKRKKRFSPAPENLSRIPENDYTRIFITASSVNEEKEFDHWIHVVMVYDIGRLKADGSFSLSVWDINERTSGHARKLVTSRQGNFYWPDLESEKGEVLLSSVKLYPEDDVEIGAIIRNKTLWCKKGKRANKVSICSDSGI